MTMLVGEFLEYSERDSTFLLTREEAIQFINVLDLDEFNIVDINTDGDFFYVSVTRDYLGKNLFVQSVFTNDGDIYLDETEVYVVSEFVPMDIVFKTLEINSFEEYYLI